jgi:predicted transposase YbfD/YdcC
MSTQRSLTISPIGKKNGNVEVRKIWCNRVDAEYVRERLNVPNCQTLVRVDRVVRKPGGKPTTESRYFITSLVLSAICLLRLVRGHWQVENCLHWMKDTGWNEDKHSLKHGQQMFVELTNVALSLLHLMKMPDESVQELTEDVKFSPKNVLYSLGFD